MARFSEAAIHRVREATDLVELAGRYTEMRRAGADRMVGRCPLHDERTPSFTISPAKQLFKCFGCDAGGDALSLVQLKEGLDFPAALEFLAQRAGVQLEDEDPGFQARRERRARELVPLDRAAAFYAAHLCSPRSKSATQAAEYLAVRGINEVTRQQFELGFAPPESAALLHAAEASGFSAKELTDVGLVTRPRGGGPPQDRFRGRLMFPVCDVQARVLGFGARKLGRARGPKYVNSPASAIFNKSELLYGAHHARAAAAKAGIMIVVEGYIDALAMHQAGCVNTVALMGTSITDQQVIALRRLAPTVVFMLDGDEGGARALLRAGVLARPSGLEVLVAALPEGTDPAELLQRDGVTAVRELVGGAGAFARFQVQYVLDRSDISTPEAKDRIVGSLREVFAGVAPSVVREDLIALVAKRLDLSSSLLRSWLAAPRADDDAGATSVATNDPPNATVTHAGGRRLLLQCVADPQVAAALPSGDALADLFPDDLQRRAAAHIREHPLDPAAGLANDDELVSLVTGLLTAPVVVASDP